VSRAALFALVALGAAGALGALAPACGTGENGRAGHGVGHAGALQPGAPVSVTGTALDARTGKVLAGVRIEGPRGVRAVSGKDGRFELVGLREGDEGLVRASLEDGRQGSVTLRPLSSERLEIVLRLGR
jgi:hypothetical protein